jgi:hypothetical protein
MASKDLNPVVYHNKKPKFFDEFKVDLPHKMTSGHHILFRFYHAKCSFKGKKEDHAIDTLGYAVLPLYEDGKILKDGVYNLPVALVFPPNYRDSKLQDIVKWVDNKKPVFTIRTKLLSTIFPQDDALIPFFQSMKHDANLAEHEEDAKLAVRSVQKAKISSIIQMLPIIFNRFAFLISCGVTSVQQEAFSTLLSVLEM